METRMKPKWWPLGRLGELIERAEQDPEPFVPTGPVVKVDDQGRGQRLASPAGLWTDGLGRTATRALQIMLVLALAGLVVYATTTLSIVVIPVVLAFIVAAAAWPLMRFLTVRGWPSALATLAVLVTVVALLGGLITGIVFMVRSQWDDLAASTTAGLTALIGWANETFEITIDGAQITAWLEQLREIVFTRQFGTAAASSVTAGISALASFLTSFILFVVVLFFFMKDGPGMWNFLLRPVSGARERRFRLMGERAIGVLGGYVRGTTLVALVDALFIGVGLWIIGVPLAFPLAVVVFITAYIPIVGATLAGIVSALVTLVTNGPVAALIVIGIVVVVNQLEGNLLAPIVLGKSLQLHELVVLLALTVGTVLGGIVGTLLSVPFAAVAWALVKAWHEPLPDTPEQAEPDGPGDPDTGDESDGAAEPEPVEALAGQEADPAVRPGGAEEG